MSYKAIKLVVVVFAVVIVVLLAVLIFVQPAGAPELPRPLTSSDGRLMVTSPLPGALVVSPASLVGSVTGGGWFFEASFPVKILDGDGKVLGQGPVQAGADWMTTGTVPFAVAFPFKAPQYATGTIVFMKDNPSGAPENAGELIVPVRFR